MATIERVWGRGVLTCAGTDSSVFYDVRVTQDEISATNPGVIRISASIMVEQPTQEPDVGPEKLTLRLEDGRRLAGFYEGDGIFKVTGGFF